MIKILPSSKVVKTKKKTVKKGAPVVAGGKMAFIKGGKKGVKPFGKGKKPMPPMPMMKKKGLVKKSAGKKVCKSCGRAM